MKKIKIFIVLLFICSRAISQVNTTDSLCLISIYNHVVFKPIYDNWLQGPIFNNWSGITLDSTHTRVTELMLGGRVLSGTISDSIGYLTELEKFSFGGSLGCSGQIPNSICNLSKLFQLDIVYSNISGPIPDSIGKMQNLASIYLNNNQLTGSIPQSLGNLHPPTFHLDLNLSNNQLTGQIPQSLTNVNEMTGLWLDSNMLTGTLPNNMQNWSTSLGIFSCSYNQLSGSLPKILFNNTYGDLNISHNNFTDFPDTSITNAGLETIYMEANKFTFEDIEHLYNQSINYFTYSPQDSVESNIDSLFQIGDTITMHSLVGGTVNHYQWTKNDVDIFGATDSIFTVNNIAYGDSGYYSCKITNTIATQLTLHRRKIHLRVDTTIGIVESQSNDGNVRIYPNPVINSIYIESKIGNTQIVITDISGNIKMKQKTSTPLTTIDISDFSKGIYFVKVINDNGIIVKKFVKE
jgi:hypothetical protein